MLCSYIFLALAHGYEKSIHNKRYSENIYTWLASEIRCKIPHMPLLQYEQAATMYSQPNVILLRNIWNYIMSSNLLDTELHSSD